MFCNCNKKYKWKQKTCLFVCLFVTRQPATCLPADPRLGGLSSSSVSVGQLTCPVSCLLSWPSTNMNINSWIFIAGLSLLFWLLPCDTSPDPDTHHQMRQVQLALKQFQTFKEAKTFEDISFSMRVNRHCFVDNIRPSILLAGPISLWLEYDTPRVGDVLLDL